MTLRHWRLSILCPIMVVAAIAAATMAGGCNKADDDSTPPPKPVSFEGTVDEKYVGNWQTADGRQGLNLAKDGSVKILATQPTPHGDQKSTFDGQWLASSDGLHLKYLDHSQEMTIRYKTALSADSMTLSEMGGRLKTKYLRKP
jgi:hypothetical protein